MKRIRKKQSKAAFALNPKYHAKVALMSLRHALLRSLRHALLREQYEICSKIIAVAKEHGAPNSEIQYLLEDPRRVPE